MGVRWSGEGERASQQALLDYTCNNNSANRNCTTKTTLCRRLVAISCQFQLPSCRRATLDSLPCYSSCLSSLFALAQPVPGPAKPAGSTWLGLFGFALCYRKTFNVCLGFVAAATFVFAHFAHMY